MSRRSENRLTTAPIHRRAASPPMTSMQSMLPSPLHRLQTMIPTNSATRPRQASPAKGADSELQALLRRRLRNIEGPDRKESVEQIDIVIAPVAAAPRRSLVMSGGWGMFGSGSPKNSTGVDGKSPVARRTGSGTHIRANVPQDTVEELSKLRQQNEQLRQQVEALRSVTADLSRENNALATKVQSDSAQVDGNQMNILEVEHSKLENLTDHVIYSPPSSKPYSLKQEPAPEPSPAKQAIAKAPPEYTPELSGITEKAATSEDSCSEGRLRVALTKQSTTTEELRSATEAVEALLGEAKRELAGRELRDRRAAYERLHAAMEHDDVATLAGAINEAQKTGVHTEDIDKARERLDYLQSMSAADREAKDAHKRLNENKKQAFLFVKQDNAFGLQTMMEVEVGGKAWKDWKDHSGRSLWIFALEVKARNVQRYLAPHFGIKLPASPSSTPTARSERHSSHSLVGGPPPDHFCLLPLEEAAPQEPAPASPSQQLPSPKNLESSEEAALRVKAFRAVVGDDNVALAEVFETVPEEVWTKWENKAGRDLMTLSQERGSPSCYSLIAKALGILVEMEQEAFEEGMAVWVLMPGELQPRHATVLEDTLSEAENVLVEFWDGDDAPMRVEHCLVSKANN